MTVEDTLTGAKSGLAFLLGYQNAVAQEIGMEQALALHSAMAKAMGTARGKELRERVDVKEIPPELAASLVGEFLEQAMGIRSSVTEATEEKAVIKAGRCPQYEVAEAFGMENAAIEALCRASGIQFLDALVKQLNPDLEWGLSQFRSSADASCFEIVVAQGR